MDGCAKQYRSITFIMLISVFARHFGVNVDRMIQAPHHGKDDFDWQGGIDKNYLQKYFRRIIKPEESNNTNDGAFQMGVVMATYDLF